MSIDMVIERHPAEHGIRGTRKRQKRQRLVEAASVLHRTRGGRGVVGALLVRPPHYIARTPHA